MKLKELLKHTSNMLHVKVEEWFSDIAMGRPRDLEENLPKGRLEQSIGLITNIAVERGQVVICVSLVPKENGDEEGEVTSDDCPF